VVNKDPKKSKYSGTPRASPPPAVASFQIAMQLQSAKDI